MITGLKRFFEPPDLGSIELNRRASLLRTILVFLLAFTMTLGLLYWVMVPNWLGRLFVLIAMGVEFISFLTLKTGRIRLAGAILVYLLWVVLMLTILLTDGIRGPSALGQLLLIFLAGLLIGVRFSAVLTVITLVGNYAALLLELNGALMYGNLQLTLAGNWVFQSAYILLAFGLMMVLGRSLRQSLDEVLDSEQGLKEHLAELRQAQAQLEMSDQNLRRRERILATLREAAEILFRDQSFDDAVNTVLQDLGEATEIDRVYIFENHTEVDGELLASQSYEWVAKEVKAQIDNPALQNFSFKLAGFTRWAELLGRNEIVKGHVKDFPDAEREVLAALGMVSVLVVPIFVGNDWWGFMGFDETEWERQWSPAEEDALRGAGGILGGAFERRRSEEALKLSEARYLAILQDQYDMIIRYKPDGSILFVNEAYARFYGVDPEKLTGISVLTQIPPEILDAWKAKIASLTAKAPMSSSQNLNQRADGEQRWIEWTDRGVFDQRGRLLEVQAVGRDIHEEVRLRKQLEENLIQMETQAMTDAATGLLNRRAIMEHAEAEWQRAQREKRPLSLVVMDVDKLKDINDTYGHLVGDQALIQMADMMHHGMRRYDWVGRWGGDEFLLVLPGSGLQEAREVADRLRLKFKQKKIKLKGGKEIELHVSLGVAAQTDHGTDTLQSMLARADRALYKAKASGRDQVEVEE